MATNPNPATVKERTLSLTKAKPIRAVSRPPLNPSDVMQRILPEDLFLGMLCLDRKRAERSGKKLLLMLLDAEDAAEQEHKAEILKGVARAVDVARRDTDPAGWYKSNCVLGIIFTDLGTLDERATINKLLDKMHHALITHLTPEDFDLVHVSIHTFADDSDEESASGSENPAFYPDLFHRHESKKGPLVMKRAMDIGGSLLALLLLSPFYLLIAAIIKLTSKGPVFFTQERLGQFGEKFTCLKFRSMFADNDLRIHQEFMKKVISGTHDGKADGSEKPTYKMANDPRVTRIGKLLRRTSLDELPQFLNVLKGEMSLVGPRPPLAYEYEEYDIWHRRRVLEAKPGITGLWQVRGRSRVRFDDMVRLDLRYVREWSLLLDIQILIQTPRAVVLGDGAY
jgi:exopolysaccharide biosynthesis polyprenyl glycosylphosphotransferase